MAIFLTADTHFYHRNIIDYCDRPYRTLDGQPDPGAMNLDLIARWNAVVGKDDTVYHLGDFGFGPPAKLIEIRKALNGTMILVRGNHDSKPDKWLLKGDNRSVNWVEGSVFMTHIPPFPNPYHPHERVIPPPPQATILLCGHVHGAWDSRIYVSEGRARTVYNVGVDVRNLAPIPLESLPGVTEAWTDKVDWR